MSQVTTTLNYEKFLVMIATNSTPLYILIDIFNQKVVMNSFHGQESVIVTDLALITKQHGFSNNRLREGTTMNQSMYSDLRMIFRSNC